MAINTGMEMERVVAKLYLLYAHRNGNPGKDYHSYWFNCRDFIDSHCNSWDNFYKTLNKDEKEAVDNPKPSETMKRLDALGIEDPIG
jgi:hypothetical protein